MKKAFRYYKKLANLTFYNEPAIVNECIQFNEDLLIKEPDKIQCYFYNRFPLP